ncbi:MAG: type I restriction-modification system subunit M N-terminal domain-containing protein [Oscillospiraceae bacterium]|nr:type I restriction-modification system subunit M N-terminal domain-containing protein [Oscillospiraceae bacterium]
MAVKKSELYSSLWASCDSLRGGMDSSQYKDYILTLLFVKYISDKFKGVAYGDIDVPGSDIVILTPKQEIDSIFWGYYLNSSTISSQKALRGQGDAVVHISANALSSIEIKCPQLTEQTAIATILSEMDAEINALSGKLQKLKNIISGMMSELLTGRIRLLAGGSQADYSYVSDDEYPALRSVANPTNSTKTDANAKPSTVTQEGD